MRFNGTLFITWSAFQAGDTSNIATANVTLPIVNGVLNVCAGAHHHGFRRRAVQRHLQPERREPIHPGVGRAAQHHGPAHSRRAGFYRHGGRTGARYLAGHDFGRGGVDQRLGADRCKRESGSRWDAPRLSIRPGLIDGASGNLSDCIHVDGSSGSCGTRPTGVYPGFSDSEVPSGAINGSNAVFTLAFTPSPAGSLNLYLNGLRLDANVDYTLSTNTITFSSPRYRRPAIFSWPAIATPIRAIRWDR